MKQEKKKKINGKGKDTEKRDSERVRKWESVLRFDTKPIALCKRFDRIMSRELLIYALPFVLACVCVCVCICFHELASLSHPHLNTLTPCSGLVFAAVNLPGIMWANDK